MIDRIILDNYEDEWIIREARPTEHGFPVLLGVPVLQSNLRAGGGKRVILTTELVTYLLDRRYERGSVKLPIGNGAVKRARKLLGLNHYDDTRQWWEDHADELLTLTEAEFGRRHNYSPAMVSKMSTQLFGPRQRPSGWWKQEPALSLLRGDSPRAMVAERLGISVGAVGRMRWVLRSTVPSNLENRSLEMAENIDSIAEDSKREDTPRERYCRLVGRLLGALSEKGRDRKITPLLKCKVADHPHLWRQTLANFREELDAPRMAPFVEALAGEEIEPLKPNAAEEGIFWLSYYHGRTAYQTSRIRSGKAIAEKDAPEVEYDLDGASRQLAAYNAPEVLFELDGASRQLVAYDAEKAVLVMFPQIQGGWGQRRHYRGYEGKLSVTEPDAARGTGWPGLKQSGE